MRNKIALACSVVLGLSFISAPAWADDGLTAPPAAGSSAPKTVAESPTGSYLVTMYADPLVASIPADELSSDAAQAKAVELEATHDQVLADAGVSTADKVQDYSNALNGFSAIIDHADAVRAGCGPEGQGCGAGRNAAG